MTMPGMVRNKQNRIVGSIENRIFTKKVHGNKHMIKVPAMAWAIDADVFDRIIKPNCLSIHIIDIETKGKYVVGVKSFDEKKKVLNRGFNKQYYLELLYWITQTAK